MKSKRWYAWDVLRLLRAYRLKYKIANLVCGLLPTYTYSFVRVRLYRLAGFKQITPSSFIGGNVELISNADEFYNKLTVGEGCVIAFNVTMNLDAEIRLGNNVTISPYVMLYTSTHQKETACNRQMTGSTAKPIIIEDGCWIASGAVILPGVTVGRGSIVAAGAVVTQDVPPNVMVKGNPARVAQRLPEDPVQQD